MLQVCCSDKIMHTHTRTHPKKINILILALQKPIILPSSVLSLSAAPFFHNIPWRWNVSISYLFYSNPLILYLGKDVSLLYTMTLFFLVLRNSYWGKMFPKLVIMCSDYRGCWCVSTASYTRNWCKVIMRLCHRCRDRNKYEWISVRSTKTQSGQEGC